MSMAQLVLTAVTIEHRSKTEVAATYGLSRRWVQKLLLRYAEEGEAAFEPRSRRPRSSPGRTPDNVEDEIVEMRKFLAESGLDAGAATGIRAGDGQTDGRAHHAPRLASAASTMPRKARVAAAGSVGIHCQAPAGLFTSCHS